MLKLEEGKYYRTRGGVKVGPMKAEGPWFSCHTSPMGVGAYWWPDGGREKSREQGFDLVSEWVEETTMDIYSLEKPFGWLDEATQQALKDHYEEGGDVEIYTAEGWRDANIKGSLKCYFYKALVHRAVKKPEVVEQTLWGFPYLGPQGWDGDRLRINTHKITFNIVDGEPDCNSIKMERL